MESLGPLDCDIRIGDKDCKVLVCPLCAKGVKLVPGEDPNVTFERHTQSGCDTSNYKKVMNKPRCPVNGCNEKLTFSNTVTCKDCHKKVRKPPRVRDLEASFMIFELVNDKAC